MKCPCDRVVSDPDFNPRVQGLNPAGGSSCTSLHRASHYHTSVISILLDNVERDLNTTVLSTSFRKSFFARRFKQKSKYVKFCHDLIQNHFS